MMNEKNIRGLRERKREEKNQKKNKKRPLLFFFDSLI